MTQAELRKREEELTAELRNMQDEAFEIYIDTVDKDFYSNRRAKSLQGMHAIIGSKNNIFADCIRMQFANPRDFIAVWLKGLNDRYGSKVYTDDKGIEYKYILINLLKNLTFRNYAFTFLERNFYRNLVARIRFKPDEMLWDLWFGSGHVVYGILITPVLRHGSWTNDVSEIRRANYNYWTIGHIMSTGIVDPDSDKLFKFSSYDDLYAFYRSVLKKLSSSEYEKAIFDLYIKYLSESDDIDNEPLLIPEIRYAGLEKEHKYRIDFTILNSHTNDYIGIELSPSSSHMSISGIRSKTQTDFNKELAIKWSKEMQKRNDYFNEYDIQIITFTDEELVDINNVFATLEKFLKKRDIEVSFEEELRRLDAV